MKPQPPRQDMAQHRKKSSFNVNEVSKMSSWILAKWTRSCCGVPVGNKEKIWTSPIWMSETFSWVFAGTYKASFLLQPTVNYQQVNCAYPWFLFLRSLGFVLFLLVMVKGFHVVGFAWLLWFKIVSLKILIASLCDRASSSSSPSLLVFVNGFNFRDHEGSKGGGSFLRSHRSREGKILSKHTVLDFDFLYCLWYN